MFFRITGFYQLLCLWVCCCEAVAQIDWQAGKGIQEQFVKDIKEYQKIVPINSDYQQLVTYTCYEPKQLSSPSLTIITQNKWIFEYVEDFIRTNRLRYIKRHGYRYCELQGRVDQSRHIIWSRVPFILATLPCTEFLIHMDGDDIFFNEEFSLKPWMDFMVKEDVSMLMSEDYIESSPVNFGVFMVRNKSWVYEMFREAYNVCACDHARLWPWPREQGVVYDLLAKYDSERNTTIGSNYRIISSSGWNQWWKIPGRGWNHIEFNNDNFVVHFAGCCLDEENHVRNKTFVFKYRQMIRFHDTAFPDKPPVNMEDDFRITSDACKPMMWSKITDKKNYLGLSMESSLLDYDLGADGSLEKVLVHSQVCPKKGQSTAVCQLHRYWQH
eukprot:TRINITY_DN1058_c0_g2_i1.p2 TRINITY_DN1058_c0_g2~~TRINITY_DN1058_c0_g2_i1.p2  ORF type:complete len:384 (+),score=16.73 TRINITY_DN1058_c0_g2_i1:3807-4958(+)